MAGISLKLRPALGDGRQIVPGDVRTLRHRRVDIRLPARPGERKQPSSNHLDIAGVNAVDGRLVVVGHPGAFRLGTRPRDEIDIRIVKVSSIVAGEMAENEIRKDFTPTERVAIADAVKTELGMRHGQRNDKLPDDGPGVKGDTRDIAAKRAGFGSGKQLERAENVVKLGVPKLVAKMDSGEVSISTAATIAKAAPAVQDVSRSDAFRRGDQPLFDRSALGGV